METKSDYDILLMQFEKMGMGFNAYKNTYNPHVYGYFITIQSHHAKVDMVGVHHATFCFDNTGKFQELLVEE